MHNCDYCSFTVEDDVLFTLHNLTHHSKKYRKDHGDEFTCSLCGYEGKLRSGKPHYRQFHEIYEAKMDELHELELERCDYICGHCDPPKVAKDDHYLNLHKSRKHPDLFEREKYLRAVEEARSKDYVCEKHDPPKGYSQKGWYRKHLEDEHGLTIEEQKSQEALDYEYTCKQCSPWRGFTNENGYTSHLAHHHPDFWQELKDYRELCRDWVCTWCENPNGFDNQGGLKSHWVQCHSDKFDELKKWCEAFGEYNCPECHKAYDSQGALGVHITRVHDCYRVEKSCVICGDNFEIVPSCKDAKFTCGSEECTKEYMSQITPSGDDHRWSKDYHIDRRYYGPNWEELSEEIKEKYDYKCQECGMTEEEHYEKYNCGLNVDHLIPFNKFTDWYKIDKVYKVANMKINLKPFCASCHTTIEHQKEYDNRQYWNNGVQN